MMAAVENGGAAFAEDRGKDQSGTGAGDAAGGDGGRGRRERPRRITVKTGESQGAVDAGGISGGKKSASSNIRKGTTGKGGGLQIPVIKQTTDESALKVNVGLGAWGGTKKDPNRMPVMNRPVVPPLGFQLLNQHPRRLDSQTMRPLLERMVLSTRGRKGGHASMVAGGSAWERHGALTDRGARGRGIMQWGDVSGATSPRSTRAEDESMLTAKSGLEVDYGRGGERHHRGIDMMFLTGKSSRGLLPHKTGLGDEKVEREQSFESVASSTRRRGTVFKETSWGSRVSAASTGVPHLLSPSISPTQRQPHRHWADRTGGYVETAWERPAPHSLGEPVPSIVVTPDLVIDRWPAENTSTQWRSHARPAMVPATGTSYSQHWHANLPCLTPRGFPAPGGGPNQHPKKVQTVLTATSIARPQRPFTHASAEGAQELLMQAREHIWLNEQRKAIPKLDRALAMEPNFAEALALLGKLRQEERQEYHLAESLFQRALKLQPDNLMALSGMAQILDCRGNVDMADQLYEKAVAVSGDDLSLIMNYAVFLRDVCKDVPRAREMLLKAHRLAPKHPWLQAHGHEF